jgi:hypothetical protein
MLTLPKDANLQTKKCPHVAGINPFLGGDGGDKIYSICIYAALQQVRLRNL